MKSDFRIVYRDLNLDQTVDIMCNDETYYELKRQQDNGDIQIMYDERRELF
ncbi:hypothetical protein AAXE64_08200 [Priestia megaterium]